MSLKSETKAKTIHGQTAEWLDSLESKQVRALASQNRIQEWASRPLQDLIAALMLLPAVQIAAGVIDAEEVQPQE